MTTPQQFARQAVMADTVKAFHDACLAQPTWPKVMIDFTEDDVWRWVATNHRNNCLLWDEEDLARRTKASDADITANNRAIDGYNQARNDATERVDELLLVALRLVTPESARSDTPVAAPAQLGARLHSETAGSMADRLSILALKCRAMTEQTQRADASEAHRAVSAERLMRLQTQQQDLADALDGLLADTQAGRAWFKVYRQFKMYNDPAFNLALVAEAARAASALRQS